MCHTEGCSLSCILASYTNSWEYLGHCIYISLQFKITDSVSKQIVKEKYVNFMRVISQTGVKWLSKYQSEQITFLIFEWTIFFFFLSTVHHEKTACTQKPLCFILGWEHLLQTAGTGPPVRRINFPHQTSILHSPV